MLSFQHHPQPGLRHRSLLLVTLLLVTTTLLSPQMASAAAIPLPLPTGNWAFNGNGSTYTLTINSGDSLNIADMARPAHTILLGAGVPVCEHMTNLASVDSGGGRLHAVPIAWVGGATFPVRAYGVSDQ